MKKAFLICSYILLYSFSTAIAQIPKDVENVLKRSGKNRYELEKVINYYKKKGDNLKLKAVYFLISNMDIHYSVNNYLRDSKGKRYPFNEFKYLTYPESQKALRMMKEKYNLYNVNTQIPDISSIKGSFLISNIEQAFSVKNSKYGKLLKFEDFCEYVLPYRVSIEPLNDWRLTYKKRFSFLSNRSEILDSKNLANLFAQDFKTWFSNTFGSEDRGPLPRLSAQQLLFYKKGPCEDISDLLGFSFRSQGVPIALDEVTFWATASGRHYFNALFDAKMNSYPVYDISTKIFTNTPFQREPAKVIRRTFSKQANVISRQLPQKQIPPGFMRSQNFKDVTSEYWNVKDIITPLIKKKNMQPKFAFISVFNELTWKPTWWGIIKNGSTTFKSMCQGAVFLPQYYINDKLESAGYPIVSGYSRQVILKPDLNTKRTIRIFPKDKYLIFRKDMHYILHYWSNKGWEIIETVLIDDPSIKYLEFKGVPENCLLLLLPERSSNLERPFTIANDGTQQWW